MLKRTYDTIFIILNADLFQTFQLYPYNQCIEITFFNEQPNTILTYPLSINFYILILITINFYFK